MAWGKARYIGISNCFAWQIAKVNALAEKIVQTAGREQLGKFAPMFSHLNDDILFGEVWNEKAIDVKTKCIITVVSLMASGIIVCAKHEMKFSMKLC